MPGVFRSIRPRGPLDRPEEISGAALEGMVAQHLRAWISYGDDRNQLFFWRTRAGAEVDFVVYGDDGLWAIEVKNGSKIHDADLRGLRAFQVRLSGGPRPSALSGTGKNIAPRRLGTAL